MIGNSTGTPVSRRTLLRAGAGAVALGGAATLDLGGTTPAHAGQPGPVTWPIDAGGTPLQLSFYSRLAWPEADQVRGGLIANVIQGDGKYDAALAFAGSGFLNFVRIRTEYAVFAIDVFRSTFIGPTGPAGYFFRLYQPAGGGWRRTPVQDWRVTGGWSPSGDPYTLPVDTSAIAEANVTAWQTDDNASVNLVEFHRYDNALGVRQRWLNAYHQSALGWGSTTENGPGQIFRGKGPFGDIWTNDRYFRTLSFLRPLDTSFSRMMLYSGTQTRDHWRRVWDGFWKDVVWRHGQRVELVPDPMSSNTTYHPQVTDWRTMYYLARTSGVMASRWDYNPYEVPTWV